MPGMTISSYFDNATGIEMPQTSRIGLLDYGTYPELGYQSSAVTITASASGTILFTTTDITAFNGLIVEVVSIGGTSPQLNAFPSVDGTNYAATALGWVNLQTNAVISGATGLIAVGIYALINPIGGRVKFKALRMTQTGGAADQASSIRYAHFWA